MLQNNVHLHSLFYHSVAELKLVLCTREMQCRPTVYCSCITMPFTVLEALTLTESGIDWCVNQLTCLQQQHKSMCNYPGKQGPTAPNRGFGKLQSKPAKRPTLSDGHPLYNDGHFVSVPKEPAVGYCGCRN